MRSGGARLAFFLTVVLALGAVLAAVVRSAGLRTPLGIAVLLAVELTAIAVAVGFHLLELPHRPPGDPARRRAFPADLDYL